MQLTNKIIKDLLELDLDKSTLVKILDIINPDDSDSVIPLDLHTPREWITTDKPKNLQDYISWTTSGTDKNLTANVNNYEV